MKSRLISIFGSFLIIIIFLPILIFFVLSKIESNQKSDKENNLDKDIIVKNQEENIKATLKQQEIIEDIDLKETQINQEEIENKIQYLKQKNNSLAFFESKTLWNFYFVDWNYKLSLYNSEKKLWEYSKSDFLDFKEVIWNDNYIFFQIWENKYLYNLKTNKSTKLNIELKIEYIKKAKTNIDFLFKTEVWTFVYDLKQNQFNYFNYFDDFVYFENWYIGIINKDDKIRLKNLSIKNTNANLIYYYNPISKEKKQILSTNKLLKKIYLLDNKIYFEDTDWKIYNLENFSLENILTHSWITSLEKGSNIKKNFF